MIQLYENYPILHAVSGEFSGLNWTHIRTILPVKDKLKSLSRFPKPSAGMNV